MEIVWHQNTKTTYHIRNIHFVKSGIVRTICLVRLVERSIGLTNISSDYPINLTPVQKAVQNNYSLRTSNIQDVEQYMCRNRAIGVVLDQIVNTSFTLLLTRWFRRGESIIHGSMYWMLMQMPKEVVAYISRLVYNHQYSKDLLKNIASNLGY